MAAGDRVYETAEVMLTFGQMFGKEWEQSEHRTK